jgi:hypothetical protein
VQKSSVLAAAAAAVPPAQAKPEPAPLTSGVIQSQSIAAIPGSSEPMKPVKVKTVQIKAGQMKVASAAPSQSATSITSAIPPARTEVPETSGAIVAKAEGNKEARRSPHRMDHPGRRPRQRRRGARAHRGRPQSGPRSAQQGRSLHRTGGLQGR